LPDIFGGILPPPPLSKIKWSVPNVNITQISNVSNFSEHKVYFIFMRTKMVLDILTVHHILKNTAIQNVNKPFVYITGLTSSLLSMQIADFLVNNVSLRE
jgi:hypothetical protein